jgi:hypothetical protein
MSVPKINASWWARARGFFDHGLLIHAFSGKLWPTKTYFDESLDYEIPEGEGGILIVPGRWIRPEDERGGIKYIRDAVKRTPWRLVLHISDEEQCFYSNELKTPTSKLWIQTVWPHKPSPADRGFLLGWPADTRDLLPDIKRRPLSDRRLWCFYGQNTNPPRNACIAELRKRPEGEGELLETSGFCQGLPRSTYLKNLTESAIALSPSGPFHPDCFRTYEALEAGCLPIVDRRGPGWPNDVDYWKHVIGENPFPAVDNWSEVHSLLDYFKSNPVEL